MIGSLPKLNKYFRRYKKKLFLGILFIFISNLGQVYIPILLKNGINALQQNLSFKLITEYALLIVITSAIAGFFRFLIRQTIIVISREIEYDLRQDFWSHIQKLPLRFFQNNSTGNIMALATNDINAVRSYVGPAVMYSIDTGLKFILILTIILSISFELTFYALLPLPILSYLVYILSKKIHSRFTKIQEKFSELTTKAQENFSGIRVIKSYIKEEYEIEQFSKLNDDYLKRNMDKVKIQALFQPVLYMTAGLSSIIVLWAGGNMVINGKLLLGDIIAFMVYLGMLIWPMIAFGWVANMVQQADASLKRLLRMFNEPYEISDNEKTEQRVNELNGNIEFKNVSFKYLDNLHEILRNINFKIEKGQTVAFIGHTGVGKTTLVNLIPRLYDVKEGEVLIDGVNVKEIPLAILRKNIGMVPQETFLFSDTLTNNLLYGQQNGDKNLVEKISSLARIDKDVETFPLGYETILGERGITLSGGQKQRTALARALAIDPKILILDDSFSAVDTNTEEEILKNLKEYMKGRTSIIISHRISTVKDSDKIFVLDNGSIIEEGTHEELVAMEGLYAKIHSKQLLEEELEELN